MASHGSGSAQDVLDWTVNLHVIVKRFDVKVGEGRREIDSQHTGAQIKSDILLDEKFPIPGDMRRDAQNCLLYLRIKGRPKKVDNFDRLCTFGEVLKGEEVLLEILEPGAIVRNEVLDLEDDLHVHRRY